MPRLSCRYTGASILTCRKAITAGSDVRLIAKATLRRVLRQPDLDQEITVSTDATTLAPLQEATARKFWLVDLAGERSSSCKLQGLA
jgi:hypothetical protein